MIGEDRHYYSINSVNFKALNPGAHMLCSATLDCQMGDGQCRSVYMSIPSELCSVYLSYLDLLRKYLTLGISAASCLNIIRSAPTVNDVHHIYFGDRQSVPQNGIVTTPCPRTQGNRVATTS
jgi:hypothetical protein